MRIAAPRHAVAALGMAVVIVCGHAAGAQTPKAAAPEPAAAPVFDYPQPGTREPYQDWMVECYDAGQRCQMYQRVILRAQDPAQPPRIVLVATLAFRASDLFLEMALPLGLDLAQGATLHLGPDVRATALPLTRCTSRGCLVEGRVDSPLADALQQAARAEVRIRDPASGDLRIPLSMAGYNAALARIARPPGLAPDPIPNPTLAPAAP